jgi:hypothetical protein
VPTAVAVAVAAVAAAAAAASVAPAAIAAALAASALVKIPAFIMDVPRAVPAPAVRTPMPIAAMMGAFSESLRLESRSAKEVDTVLTAPPKTPLTRSPKKLPPLASGTKVLTKVPEVSYVV